MSLDAFASVKLDPIEVCGIVPLPEMYECCNINETAGVKAAPLIWL